MRRVTPRASRASGSDRRIDISALGRSRRVASASIEDILPKMRRFGKDGSYREAIRAFLTLPSDTDTPRMTGKRVEVSLQYAIALQHAGLFGLAKDVYERVVAAAEQPRRSAVALEAARFNALVQIAVMRERLGDPAGALRVLDELPRDVPPNDVGLARASLASWISLTRMNALLSLGRERELRPLVERLRERGDWNEQIWALLAGALLDSRSRSARRRAAAEAEIRRAVSRMAASDEAGAPWIALVAGKHLRDEPLACEFLQNAHDAATRMGKFFIIAVASELLAQNASVPESRRAWYLRRAINAYARCGLLLLLPLSQRIFRAAESFWGAEHAQQAMIQSAHLLEPREDLVFSRMCARLAKTGRYGSAAWQVFEEFVRDWALARFPGKYKHIAEGEATVDAVIIQRGESIALQAKHVQNPGSRIPAKFRFRQLRERHSIPPIRRYIFVVTSSRPRGWSESMWHSEWTEDLRNAVPEGVQVDVVTEPQLQTDVLLDDVLYDKYFGRRASGDR